MAAVGLRGMLYGIIHMPCLFNLLTGLYCPGCGGTRAVNYLLHGEVLKSFTYHPLVPYTILVVAAECLTALAAKIFRKPGYYLGHEMGFVYIGGGIILVNWIVKNVLLVGFGIDVLSVPLG